MKAGDEGAAVEWNAETGRLRVKAGTKNTVVTMLDVPVNMSYFTITADLYLVENNHGDNALFSLGAYSNNAWNTGVYLQENVYTGSNAKLTFTNFKSDGSAVQGGGSKTMNSIFKVGDKVTFTVQIGVSKTAMWFDDEFVGILENSKLGSTIGNPMILLRQNCTLELDNLTVYSGVTAPDATKTIHNTSPIAAADTLNKDADPVAPEEKEETVDPVYYPNGTVILSEDLFKGAVDTSFKKHTGGNVAWDEEKGRLVIESGAATSGVYTMVTVPKGLDHYTISADLYLTENHHGNNALFAMGINSADAWSTGTYAQLNLRGTMTDGVFTVNETDPATVWINNYDKTCTGKTKSVSKNLNYDVGQKLTVKIVVEPDVVTFFVNDSFMTAILKSNLGVEHGHPMFLLRQNCVLEVDNLIVYSGTGDIPDGSKTILNTDPIDAPEKEGEDEPVTDESGEDDNREEDGPGEDDRDEDNGQQTGTEQPESSGTQATEPEKPNSGCASVVGGSAFVAVILASVAFMIRKKED